MAGTPVPLPKVEVAGRILLRSGKGGKWALARREPRAAGEVGPGIIKGNHTAVELDGGLYCGVNGATSQTLW